MGVDLRKKFILLHERGGNVGKNIRGVLECCCLKKKCCTHTNTHTHTHTHIYIYIYIYIYILSNAKSVDGGNDSILGFSFFNIHIIQNPKESSMLDIKKNICNF